MTQFVVAALTLVVATGEIREPHDRPNVVLIMADDLGYGDLGCYGNRKIATPNLDRLASQGARLTDFYAAGSWCVPSRKGLMTGIHPYRGGVGIDADFGERITLAEMLRSHGYRTALLGKWHLGMESGLHPLEQGFDLFWGTTRSNDPPTYDGRIQVYETFRTAKEADWPVKLWHNRTVIEEPAKQSLFTKRYTEQAIKFIQRNHRRPFFLYLAHNMPHVPIYASEQYAGRSQGGVYGDVIEEIDGSVGRIVEALREQGIAQSTLFIFTSDNGPWTIFREFGGTAKPLRGQKGTAWEGGAGVPAIVSWPGTIKPSVCSEFIVGIDLYATLASMTGATLPANDSLDSIDMSRVLLEGEPSRRQEYLFFSGAKWREKPFSMRSGRYKLHRRTNDVSRDPHTAAKIPERQHDPPLLFDLHEDRQEQRDIAHLHPQRVRELQRAFDRLRDDLVSE